MKKLCIIVLTSILSLVPLSTHEAKLTSKPQLLLNPKADFRIAFEYVMKHEGYWVNHPKDYGMETYCGITKRFNPNWIGWKYIDLYKRTHKIEWNDSVPGVKWWVVDYYLDIWIKESFFEIKDQDIANYTLDFRVNATKGSEIIQSTLNEMGYNVKITGQINSVTVKCLNEVPKWEFLCKLMSNRIDFYTGLVDKRQSQIVFLNHWIKRVKVQ